MANFTGVFAPVTTPFRGDDAYAPALDLQGCFGGPCRAPLGTSDGDAIDDIKEVLATAGLL